MAASTCRECLDKAGSIVSELEALIKCIESKPELPFPRPLPGGLRPFLRSVVKERDALQSWLGQLSDATLSQDSLDKIHKDVMSSAVEIDHAFVHWDMIKKSRDLVAIEQSFAGSSKEERRQKVDEHGASGRQRSALNQLFRAQAKVKVAVVQGGHEWIDIRFVQPARLVRQMTDSGWSWGDYELGDAVSSDEWEDVQLAKQVRKLVAAAKMNRYEYRIPRVRLILPNISSQENNDVRIFLDQIRRMDPMVEILLEFRDGPWLTTPPLALDVAIENLVGDKLASLSQVLNLDNPILVDLISDLTHCKLEPKPWQESSTQAQIIEEQRHGGLMARTLYYVLKNKTLVCTRQAAEHLHEVLRTVGTEAERERGRLLVARDPEDDAVSPAAARKRFAELSCYEFPDDVQFPVKVLWDEYWDEATVQRCVEENRLPRVALDVARSTTMKSAKLSMYMYGWAAKVVTVTSNKEVRGHLRTLIEANRHAEDEVGPSIFRVDVTRNLLSANATPRSSSSAEQ
ncbi:hypothetical protein B0I35DRAFT_476835 [Stachybotrys elegans]|uniref:DUF1308 domain-containing protein n=1 Tax=Stachybotrys elegans TaxID=80388 RepID=A0A8K0WUV4_9HYPO|nr:hypothetical protein B0I35DRAFT_476835 [Stachybotrys elegans]